VIQIYKSGEVPMFSQALKVAEALASKHKTTIASGRGQKLYDELHDKYNGALPRGDKQSKSHIISRFEVMFLDTPLVRLIFILDTDLLIFKQFFRLVNSRLELEVKKIYKIKKSMKIKLIVNFDIEQTVIDQDGKPEVHQQTVTFSS